MRPMTTKFAKQVYLEEFIQMKLINLVLVMSTGEDYVTK